MRNYFYCYLFILFQIQWLHCLGQNPVARSINIQNGLPSNSVYSILQDDNGYIWFGHDKGLSKYDGKYFTNYSVPGQQGKSISNLMNYKNEIWCQDFTGNFYYTRNNAFYKEQYFKSTGSYTSAGIINGNTITLTNYDSAKSYNIITKKYTSIVSPPNVYQAVLHDNAFQYFLTANSLLRFNGNVIDTVQNFNMPLPPLSFLIKIDSTFYAFKRSDNTMLYKITKNNFVLLSIFKDDVLIQDINVINNEVWICTSKGAYCFDKQMKPKYDGKCFFSANSITKVYKDSEGSYWIGTLNKGVIFVPDINVLQFKYANENISSLANFNNDEIVAGTSSNIIFSFNTISTKFNTLTNIETKGDIVALFYDKSNKYLISCSNTIDIFQNDKKVYSEFLAGKAVTKVSEQLYVAAFAGGIILLSGNNKTFNLHWLLNYQKVLNSKHYLTQGYRGRCVLFDTLSQTLYTSTSLGIQYYNIHGTGFIQYNNKPIYAASLTSINGVVYAGTFSDGIFKIKNNNAISLNMANEKFVNSISKLAVENNFLWIAGDDSLQCYNTINNNLTTYTTADGLPTAEIKDMLIKNDKVYLATTEGLIFFNTSKSSNNTIPPSFVLSKILVNGKEQLLNVSQNLGPAENNIDIYFSVLAFKNNEECKVYYSINDNSWIKLPNGVRNLQLALLPAGKYSVKLKALNEDGVASNNIITLTFSIAAPFYKRVWFIVLLVVIFIASMYIYFKVKLHSQKQRNELLAQKIQLEKELYNSMLASIKSQMNPHFLFNALNTVQSFIYTNDKENASIYLGKFSDLTRIILDMSNNENVLLSDEIKAIKLYVELEQYRFEDKLMVNIDVSEQLTLFPLKIPSMLIQPYIENAIKHGLMHQKNDWRLLISFKKQDGFIEVIIDDNGIGRAASEAIYKNRQSKHKSFATNANAKRLELLNKGLHNHISVQIIDKVNPYHQPLGTKVILHIPYTK